MATTKEIQYNITELSNRLSDLKRLRLLISGCTQQNFEVSISAGGAAYSTKLVEVNRNYCYAIREAYDKVRVGFTEGLDIEIAELRSKLSVQYLALAGAHEDAKQEFLSKASNVLKED